MDITVTEHLLDNNMAKHANNFCFFKYCSTGNRDADYPQVAN